MNNSAGKPSIDSAKLNRVLAEYIRRREQGEEIDVELFCEAHPELADALRSYAAGEGLIEAVVGNAAAESDPSLVDSNIAQNAETVRPGTAERTDLPNQGRFGKYQIIRTLGEGAMGSIFLARDTNLDREVALKIPKFNGKEGHEFRQRFSREARAAARLDHPNICRVYDADEIDGIPYISMAYLEGEPLSRFIGTDACQDQRRVAAVVHGIALGLAHAHKNGVLHRDLKPGNVMMLAGSHPCITDFGLARQIDAGEESRLTHEGTILGTPAYMSPEQIEGNSAGIGPATDIYALGVILYELLASRLPFTGSVMAILGKALRDRPKPISKLRPDVDAQLEDLCLQMLEKSPGKRPASMQEVADRLQAWLDQTSPESKAAKEEARRNIETLEQMKKKITELVKRGQFAAAVSGLEKMIRTNISEGAEYVAWAREKLPEVKRAPKKLRAGLPALLEAAKQCMKRHDYAQAAQLLQEIPSDFRSEEAQTLLDEAIELQDEADLLLTDLQDCVRRKEFRGIEENLKRFLELKPGNRFAQRLRESLQTYSKVPWNKRTYQFDEKGRLQPMTSSLADNWLLWGVGTFLLVLGVMFWGVMIYLKSGDRTLPIEIDSDWLKDQGGAITLEVNGDEHRITGPGIDITVSLGEQAFSVKNGDTIVHNPQTFTIEKEGRQILRIDGSGMSLVRAAGRLEHAADDTPSRATSQPADDQPAGTSHPSTSHGWRDLFNGKDLAGWKGLTNVWSWNNGELIGSTDDQQLRFNTVLHSDRTYGDFEIAFDIKLEGNQPNSGFQIRSQIMDAAKFQVSGPQVDAGTEYWGGLYGEAMEGMIQTADQETVKRIVLPDDYNHFHIRCVDNHVTIRLNGTVTVDNDFPKMSPEGVIGWQVHKGRRMTVRVRNARIREITPPPMSNIPTPWRDLFNGKDLTGWQVIGKGNWSVRNGTLVGEPEGRGYQQGWLMSDNDFDDFELEFEYRLPKGGNSGVFFGAFPVGNNFDVTAFHEIQLLDDTAGKYASFADNQRTGSLYDQIAASPVLRPAPNRWHQMQIKVQSGRVTVRLNGKQVVAGPLPKEKRSRGRIGLQLHTGRIEFRNIRQRTLSSAQTSSVTEKPSVQFPFPDDARFTGGTPVTAVNQGSPINAYPWISPDGLTLYWTREGTGAESAIMQAYRSSPQAPFASVREVLKSARLASVSPDGLEIVCLADPDGTGNMRRLCSARRSSTTDPFDNLAVISSFSAIQGPKGSAISNDGKSLLVFASVNRKTTIYRSERSGPGTAWGTPRVLRVENLPLEMKHTTWPSFAAGRTHLVFSHSDPDNPAIEWGGVADATGDPLTFTNPRQLLLDGKPFVTRGARYCAATGELFYTHPLGEPPYRRMEIRVARRVDMAGDISSSDKRQTFLMNSKGMLMQLARIGAMSPSGHRRLAVGDDQFQNRR